MKTSNNKNYQQAKQAAQRIYKRVNYDGGNLQSYQLSSLLQQTYDFLKIPFKPSTNDLKQYNKVLDANGDGSVSLQDLQTLAVQYLCGEGVLANVSTSQVANNYSESQYSSSSFQNVPVNDYTSYNTNQNAQRSSKFESEGDFNYGNYNQYGSGSQYNEQSYTNTANNAYGGYQQNSYTNKNTFSGSGVNNNFQYQNSYNALSQSGAGMYGSSGNTYNSGASGYNNTLQGYGSVSQSQQHMLSKQSNQVPSVSQSKSKYTQIAQNYLTITRGLFTKYSNKQSNTITRDKVASLLNETYSALGRKGYYPSQQDINVWMKLCDTNSDGHVQQAEYEYFVVRALQRSGIQVNA